MKKLLDHYSISEVKTATGREFVLSFKGVDQLVRSTEEECEHEAQRHYNKRKLRNFSNQDLERGHFLKEPLSKALRNAT